jgi:hypothetical protein
LKPARVSIFILPARRLFSATIRFQEAGDFKKLAIMRSAAWGKTKEETAWKKSG